MQDYAVAQTVPLLCLCEREDLDTFSPAELEDAQALTMMLRAEHVEHVQEVRRRNERMQRLLDKINEYARKLEVQRELSAEEQPRMHPGQASLGHSLAEIIETERSGRLSDYDWYTTEGQQIAELHVQCPIKAPVRAANPADWMARTLRWAQRLGLAYFTVTKIEQHRKRLVGRIELPLERYDLSILAKLADRANLMVFSDIRVYAPGPAEIGERPWRFAFNRLTDIWGVERTE